MAGLLSKNISDTVKRWDASSEMHCRDLAGPHGDSMELKTLPPLVADTSHVDTLLQVFLGGQTSPIPFIQPWAVAL